MIFYVLVITMEMVKQIFVFIAKVLFTSIHPMIQLYSGPNNGETFQHSAFLSTFRHVFTRGQPGDVPLSNCDFDADGKTDFTVWTPSNTIWSWIPSNNSHLIYQYQWGFPYETPFCADFDGDHRTDFGIYRRDTGEWFIMPYNISSFLITFQWGHPTDIPVAGDFDGDGKGNDTDRNQSASITFFTSISTGDFALWRPRVNRTYVWEIIPSRMPNVIIRKAWGVEGDDAAGEFTLVKHLCCY